MKPRRRFPPAAYAAIIGRQKHVCACGCGERLGNDPRAFHFDHIRELWDGGEDVPENLQALLIGHHKRKTSDGSKRRAKLARIMERDGLRKPRLNARDRMLGRILEGKKG